MNNDLLPRSDAVAACNRTLAHLTDITSIEEQKFVVDLLPTSDEESAWFGLTLLDSESWSDGSILLPGPWYDITTDGTSICYRLQTQGYQRYKWNDAWSCDIANRFICEYEGI